MMKKILFLTLISSIVLSIAHATDEKGDIRSENGGNIEEREGYSLSNPLKLKGVLKEEDVRKFQYEYIQKYYPNYKVKNISQIENVEKFHLEGPLGERIRLYFDISDYIKDWKKKNKKILEKSRKDLKKAIMK